MATVPKREGRGWREVAMHGERWRRTGAAFYFVIFGFIGVVSFVRYKLNRESFSSATQWNGCKT